MELYLLSLRVLVTLLILAMLLPGIGLLNVANAYQEVPISNEESNHQLLPERQP